MWQPIETAPRDNTPVLIYSIEDEIVRQACWWPADGGSIDDLPGLEEGWHYDAGPRSRPSRRGYNGNRAAEPDAWMPLPEPPQVNYSVQFEEAA